VSVRKNLETLKLRSSNATERPTRVERPAAAKTAGLVGKLLLSPRPPAHNLFRDPLISTNLKPRDRAGWKKKPDPTPAGDFKLSNKV
jgi:hypothetical protein